MSLSEYRIIKIETPTFINHKSNHAMYGGLRGRKGFIEQFDTYECQHFEYSEANNKEEQLLVYHDVIVGPKLCGHDGIVHGGIIAFLFDETVGWGHTIVQRRRRQRLHQQQSRRRRHSTGNIGNDVALMDLTSSQLLDTKYGEKQQHLPMLPVGVSANLNINFRVPLPANTFVRMKTYLVKTQKRKIYLRSTIESIPDENQSRTTESSPPTPPIILYAEATCIMVTLTSRL